VGRHLSLLGRKVVRDFIEALVKGLDGFQHFGDLGVHVLLNTCFDGC